MSSAEASGFLAIWSDIEPGIETDYLHWLTREHVQERLSVPGFLSVRIFRTQAEGLARFLIVYRLRDPGVVGSADYVARLNAPTPWSQRIMPLLKNFMRGGGRILDERGNGEGAFVAPVLLRQEELPAYLDAAIEIAKADRIAATRIFQVDGAASGIQTNEKSMRADDRSFEAMLLLESLDEDVLALGLDLLETNERLIYRQIFALDGRSLMRK